MFDSYSGTRATSTSGRFAETFDDASGTGGSSFGGVASYQVCGCCARFHSVASSVDGGGLGVILNSDDRGVSGTNGKDSLLPGDAGARISRNDMSWSGALGQAATVSFAFRVSAAVMPSDTTGFTQFTTAQIAATLQALAAWSDVAQITFNRVTDPGSQYSDNATILFGNYATGQSGAAAFAYLPGSMPGQTDVNAQPGDVWINSSQGSNTNLTALGYGRQTLLHEIGHAIGLSHPADYNAGAGQSITYGAHATYFEDSRQYTVMSYFSEQETGADFQINGVGTQYYASAPLMDDIAAAQRLYGANMTTRTGNTTYGFNSNAGQSWFSATSSTSPLVFCVWDAGGTDTLDFSGYSAISTIDLRQGAFSSVGGMVGNVSIAIGAVIENVIGGTGADTIRGNSGANRITGNGGNDSIDGGLGSDTVVFSGARASYTITWAGQVGTVTGPGGTVTVTNVEFLQFTDQTVAAAPTGGLLVGGDMTNETITGTALADTLGGLGGIDTVNGLAGNDTLSGGSGADTLSGGDGDDFLSGGVGADTINGGSGLDTADYSDAVDGVVVNLATGTASGGAGVDTLTEVENLNGSVHSDVLTGDGLGNILRGNGGIDTLNGGGGADQLFSGAPGEAGGAPDFLKPQGTANASIATAFSLAGGFDLGAHDGVANAGTIPHATVQATAHGGLEYYAITVVAGDTVFVDIDNASFDSVLRIFDGTGLELARNDDAAADSDGSRTDSSISHTFAASGTYYIQVSRWLSGSEAEATLQTTTPGAASTYTLNVSVPSAPVVPLTYIGSTMNGEAGADVLTGGVARDLLNGGTEDDSLNGGGGNDDIDGGAGTDTAVFSGTRASYTISTASGVTTVTGADGTDSLTNVERLQFSDGLFTIAGAAIGDAINGTAAGDTLNGTASDDTINGLAGDDVITGGNGNDTINGGDGLDTAVFAGTMASSTVVTAAGTTTVTGPAGEDSLTNVERLRFSDGTLIVGAGGGQYFAGGAAAETISGTAFNDQIDAGGGDDTIVGAAGNDAIDGAAGSDTAVYSGARSAYTISTAAGVTTVTGPDGTDALTNVERLQFSDGLHDITGAPIINTINGTPAADSLAGTAAVDTINGAGGDDTINGLAGNDTIDGGAGTDTAVFAGLASAYAISTVAGTTTVTGPDGTDTLTTVERLRFDDRVLIVGAGGGQYFAGGPHPESIIGTDFADQIEGAGGADVINGQAGADSIDAGDGDDTITGGAGSDAIDGGAGTDTAVFAAGAVVYTVAPAGEFTTVSSTDGNDSLIRVERLRFGSIELAIGALGGQAQIGLNTGGTLNGTAGIDNLYGLGGADILNGAGGDDILSGGAGVDTLNGGAGFDTADYTFAVGAVTARLDTNAATNDGDGGTDSFTSVENITGSDFNDLLIGNAGGNVLTGGLGRDTLLGFGGNDVLIGGSGLANQMQGGLGDDNYVVTERTDSIVELAGEGTDTVLTNAAQINLSANVENLTYFGTGTFTGAGNAIANVITGGAMRDTLVGAGGDDTLIGGAGEANNLIGGIGNDTYIISAPDSVIENAGEGIDTVRTAVLAAYNLGANVENLTNTGSQAFLAGGNALANVLTGGTGADTLRGRGGNDTLIGGAGVDTADYNLAAAGVFARLDNGIVSNDGDGGTDTLSGIENLTGSAFDDTLFGNGGNNEISGGLGRDILLGFAGNDVLRGGPGAANQLQGGQGDDTYIVDERTDSIVELANEGIDTVQTWATQLNLSANVENLTYLGTGAFTGSGNALDNIIRGGVGRDTLIGAAGDDILQGGTGQANTLIGGDGSDYYIVQAADTVVETAGAGVDTIEARVASLTLAANIENLIFGGTGNFAGTGNALNNLIVGGVGNDTLRGGGGSDTIRGGAGNDLVLLAGVAADYTIMAEAGGWRIVDGTAGRDGSILVTEVETLRFGDGSTQALGGAMPILSEKAIAADVFVLAAGFDAGPQVLPTVDHLTLPDLAPQAGGFADILGAFDDGGLAIGGSHLHRPTPDSDLFHHLRADDLWA
ncbi:M10 family metallopeptidase C-terminal domain-containing protein [Brevundimonas lenta]|uniref:Serralysin n=1 Tax=Brevundimonas lenta TaxID=424796 RepID=A0A7W6JCV5_9CAUL|nr:M10 family metallopeptidase C-terminal domain-containing protein [Brevundimonas lenta]MBB4081823.1 serralysin [Brevundimonas lenta]